MQCLVAVFASCNYYVYILSNLLVDYKLRRTGNEMRDITLNSSLISFTNVLICFINLSTDDSAPVFRSVVIASVAIERF